MMVEYATPNPGHETRIESKWNETRQRYVHRWACECGSFGRWQAGKGSAAQSEARHVNQIARSR